MPDLAGKVVLVTGAAGGLGRAMARLFADRGARLVLTARSESQLADVDLGAGSAPALRLPLDVSDPSAWEAAVDRVLREFGRLDVVVNNAGVLQPAHAHALPVAEIQRQVGVNLLGTIYGCRAALRAMRPRGAGRIVNVASLGGVMPMPGQAVYCATKYAVRGYSFSLHAELRGTGVGVCVVSPDSADTPQHRYELGFDEAAMSFVNAPLRPEAVAAAVLAATATRRPEILVPAGTGLLSRVAMGFPRLVLWLTPLLLRIGARRMAARRAAGGGTP